MNNELQQNDKSMFSADNKPGEERTKVVIEVRNGEVQTVYCNKDADIIIVDWDAANAGLDAVEDVRHISKTWLGMQRIMKEVEETRQEKLNQYKRTA